MKSLAAPISAFVATLAAVGRLFVVGQITGYSGYRVHGTMFEYLFLDQGTLDPAVAIQGLFATVVLWMAVFSTLWLILSVIASFGNASSN